MINVSTPTVEALLNKWIEVFNSRDRDTHASLYTEDAMLFGSVPELKKGRVAIRAYFSALGPNVHVRHYPAPDIVYLRPDVAVTAAWVDFADGDVLAPYRVTWTLVRQDGNWRIAQHHGSPRQTS